MAKAKKQNTYMPYPKEDRMRAGIKVSWLIYKDRAMAELAATAAKSNAIVQANLGYDFGYCCPGSIDPVADGFEVCIP